MKNSKMRLCEENLYFIVKELKKITNSPSFNFGKLTVVDGLVSIYKLKDSNVVYPDGKKPLIHLAFDGHFASIFYEGDEFNINYKGEIIVKLNQGDYISISKRKLKKSELFKLKERAKCNKKLAEKNRKQIAKEISFTNTICNL